METVKFPDANEAVSPEVTDFEAESAPPPIQLPDVRASKIPPSVNVKDPVKAAKLIVALLAQDLLEAAGKLVVHCTRA